MPQRKIASILTLFLHSFWVVAGAFGLTLLLFLVLPFMQAIKKPPSADMMLQTVESVNTPPPPPPPDEEPEEEPEPEEEQPELTEEAPPLDLSQLELALNPGLSDGWLGGDFTVKLNAGGADGDDVDALFSMSDLDQKPRVIHQPGPTLTPKLRDRAPATVYVIFIVDQNGRVENASVQKSTDPIFEGPALSAINKWKFKPGKRNGKPVRFRMRVPITFPKGS